MGIPSYFNYISNNYERIFKQKKDIHNIHDLYIDSNSIIYDVIKKRQEEKKEDISYTEIYKFVCEKIQSYIESVNPSHKVYIAIDGVPPLAKVVQQQERRYRSSFLKDIIQDKSSFNTSCITPGTTFMKDLNSYLVNYFCDDKIIISGSDTIGEGEHKIFSHIRENYSRENNRNICVYGLDADLIILSLQHISLCNTIYLFRENPEYKNVLDEIYEKNELCYLNIPMLADDIYDKLSSDDSCDKKEIIEDYVFMSYFLGNDFMPHFPSLNIRTHGIQVLLDTYKKLKKNKNFKFCSSSHILWKNISLFIKELQQEEENRFIIETNDIVKVSHRGKIGNIERKINFIPHENRDYEKYINPKKYGWKRRYYELLFDITTINDIKKVCISYLEGLEWTHTYYTRGCKNYRWYYPYKYPPLLCDLYRVIPHFQCNLIKENYHPLHEYTLLCYVLPCSSYDLLPEKIRDVMVNYDTTRNETFHFVWAYCRYFWESHLYGLDIREINEIERLLEYNSLI